MNILLEKQLFKLKPDHCIKKSTCMFLFLLFLFLIFSSKAIQKQHLKVAEFIDENQWKHQKAAKENVNSPELLSCCKNYFHLNIQTELSSSLKVTQFWNTITTH